MKNKWKKILFTTLSISTISFSFSCAKYESPKKYETFIDHNLDVIENKPTNEENKTKEILNLLLNQVYKNNKVAKERFLKSQNSTQVETSFQNLYKKYQTMFLEKASLKEEIKQIKEKLKEYEFLPFQYENEIIASKNRIQEINQKLKEFQNSLINYATSFETLMSENWYFFLTHLELFKFEFVRYVGEYLASSVENIKETNPQKYAEDKEVLTDAYLEKFATLPASKTFSPSDEFLSSIVLGTETNELNNTNIYYLNKDKMIFRIEIQGTNNKEPFLKIDNWIWYFENLKTPEISANLISSIYHFAFIHQYKEAYKQFKEDMVEKQRYGEPVFVIPVIKTKEN
ncbi:aromatic motif membrane protein [Mycoplasmopsis glycophila]|uniref:Lipoprotein n=1 Tax=Mycoplasmopsis glycophila TaxID=171285 RepID=A0A449AW01_9BACT|nr:aromatic motif membrane protein [Mycoplasmopsis glycophila]VEU70789.1 Uncharacterised protein [Mycoplasmopsis glycophila]